MPGSGMGRATAMVLATDPGFKFCNIHSAAGMVDFLYLLCESGERIPTNPPPVVSFIVGANQATTATTTAETIMIGNS